jgi:hypothetical protein
MIFNLTRAPWYEAEATPETEMARELVDGTWHDACDRFATISEIRKKSGRPEPKGIQAFLNEVLTERFEAAGWDASDSRFRLGNTWVRITFRHQMSLGSDLLDAIRLSALDGVEQCILLAADNEFLRVISPRDASVLCSYGKILPQVVRLAGAVTTPIMVGELIPQSPVSASSTKIVFGERLRS